MTSNKALVVAAIATALGILGTLPAAAANDRDRDRDRDRDGVPPCSLVGVNPVYHPEIFGNPTVAASYGFVQGPDRVWRVASNCRRY